MAVEDVTCLHLWFFADPVLAVCLGFFLCISEIICHSQSRNGTHLAVMYSVNDAEF